MYEIGTSTNNECGNNLSEVCENIKEAGFKNVMVAFQHGGGEDTVLEVKKHGLNMVFAHLDNTYANNLWARGESNKEYVESVKKQIRICAKYNIPIAVLHGTKGTPSDLAYPTSFHAIECMKDILKTCEECNVKLALENLDRPNFDHFTYLLDNIDSAYLGVCYDIGHHQLYFPEFDILTRYKNRIIAVHLHDNVMDWEYGYDYTRDLHMLPYDGKINYEEIFKKLAASSYDNVIMLELHKESSGEPRKYTNVSNLDFLKLAKERAEKLANLFEKYKNNY